MDHKKKNFLEKFKDKIVGPKHTKPASPRRYSLDRIKEDFKESALKENTQAELELRRHGGPIGGATPTDWQAKPLERNIENRGISLREDTGVLRSEKPSQVDKLHLVLPAERSRSVPHVNSSFSAPDQSALSSASLDSAPFIVNATEAGALRVGTPHLTAKIVPPLSNAPSAAAVSLMSSTATSAATKTTTTTAAAMPTVAAAASTQIAEEYPKKTSESAPLSSSPYATSSSSFPTATPAVADSNLATDNATALFEIQDAKMEPVAVQWQQQLAVNLTAGAPAMIVPPMTINTASPTISSGPYQSSDVMSPIAGDVIHLPEAPPNSLASSSSRTDTSSSSNSSNASSFIAGRNAADPNVNANANRMLAELKTKLEAVRKDVENRAEEIHLTAPRAGGHRRRTSIAGSGLQVGDALDSAVASVSAKDVHSELVHVLRGKREEEDKAAEARRSSSHLAPPINISSDEATGATADAEEKQKSSTMMISEAAAPDQISAQSLQRAEPIVLANTSPVVTRPAVSASASAATKQQAKWLDVMYVFVAIVMTFVYAVVLGVTTCLRAAGILSVQGATMARDWVRSRTAGRGTLEMDHPAGEGVPAANVTHIKQE